MSFERRLDISIVEVIVDGADRKYRTFLRRFRSVEERRREVLRAKKKSTYVEPLKRRIFGIFDENHFQLPQSDPHEPSTVEWR